ncbi:hypothetical protein [Pedobacter nyackensis]|uniref:Concanavalin A-like lectin/glucanases superfamily protein n=1 Tax=Pedobacter nyackensis TaxID=475255 RepID=A0A1W1ZYV5_9SPHI|nr:hypothetical protein [Pedobacter nyackensis]SMC53382.1 hypothetical protein SAMN04488101_101152 [Pedobacter nyackensis]
MALRKGTITEGGKKINWSETTTGIDYADGKTATPSPRNMDAKIAYKSATDIIVIPEQPPIPTIKVDHIYLASEALNSAGKKAVNGDSIQVIPDSVGGLPLKYAGVAAPILTGKPPVIWNGEILFDNEPHTLFNSNRFDRLVNYPYEETLVLRVVPGTGYEQFQNDWNNDLSIGDSGGSLRAGDADVNTQTFLSSKYDFFKVMVIHVLAESGKQTMWLNGKNIGSIPSRTTSRKLLNSVGVNTNNAQWNFIAKYVKLSKFNDEERAEHIASVLAEFKQGTNPSAPFARNINISKDAVYTAKYDYNGSLPQDVSKTQYRWLGLDSGGLGAVKILGTEQTLPLTSAAGFLNLRVEVKVFNIDGDSFRYVSMPFTQK